MSPYRPRAAIEKSMLLTSYRRRSSDGDHRLGAGVQQDSTARGGYYGARIPETFRSLALYGCFGTRPHEPTYSRTKEGDGPRHVSRISSDRMDRIVRACVKSACRQKREQFRQRRPHTGAASDSVRCTRRLPSPNRHLETGELIAIMVNLPKFRGPIAA